MRSVKAHRWDLLLLMALWLLAAINILGLLGGYKIIYIPRCWEYLEWIVLALPVFCTLWLPLRMKRAIFALAGRECRARAADSSLPPNVWLRRQLLPPVLFAAANHLAWIVPGLSWLLLVNFPPKFDAGHIAYLKYYTCEMHVQSALLGVNWFFVNLSGLLSMLFYCCYQPRKIEVLAQTVFAFVGLFLIIIWHYLLPPLFDGSLQPPMFPFLLYYFLPGALGLLFAWRHWLEACEAYYRFD